MAPIRTEPKNGSDRRSQLRHSRKRYDDADHIMEDVPIIDNTLESKQRPSGMKKGYVKVSQYNISPWKDFNEENVDMMFRDFLDNKVYNFRSKNLTTIYNSSRYENKNGEIRPFVTYSEADIVKMFEIAIADALNEALSQTAQDFQRWVNLHEPLEIRTNFEGKKIPPVSQFCHE
ncbi:hypothetical protein PG987_010062 [Apiospora arundinis]